MYNKNELIFLRKKKSEELSGKKRNFEYWKGILESMEEDIKALEKHIENIEYYIKNISTKEKGADL